MKKKSHILALQLINTLKAISTSFQTDFKLKKQNKPKKTQKNKYVSSKNVPNLENTELMMETLNVSLHLFKNDAKYTYAENTCKSLKRVFPVI